MNIIKKRKIKILLKEPRNNECFECPNKYPEYISLNNGIFLCQECVKNHFNLPRNISYIIKNNLNNISFKDIQYLSCGGNRKLLKFINDEFPNLKNFPPIYFYHTKAMDYYRRYLEYLIEGRIKPIKPDQNKGYELMSNNFLENNNIFGNNKNLNNNIFDGNFIQFNKNDISETSHSNINSDIYNSPNTNEIYPKIKPRIGLKNELRLTKSLNRFLGRKGLTPNISYYSNLKNNINNINDEYLSNRKYISTSSDFKSSYYSQFKNNYDIDGDESYNEIKEFKENEINDRVNNASELNDDLVETKEINFSTLNNIKTNSTLRRKQNIKDEENYSGIKVFKISNSITNNNNNNNINKNDKPNQKYQKNLSVLENNNNILKNNLKDNPLNLNKNKSYNNLKNKEKKLNSNIEDLKMYLNYNKNQKNRNEVNKPMIKPKKKFNNINNNIIINRNLNVFYNNNDYNLQKIFKKKSIGNSFSINEKKYKSNISSEKFHLMRGKKVLNLKKRVKNDYLNKISIKKESKNIGNNFSTFIKVNKINNKINNKKDNKTINISSDINNISFGNYDSLSSNNIFINSKVKEQKNNSNSNNINCINNNENIINQKSEIIQKISAILKAQREKREKKKSFEKIKVNQKNNYLDIKKKLIYYKLNNVELNIKVQKNKEKEKEKIKEKGKEKEKEKRKEKIKSRSYTEIKADDSENIAEFGKRNLLQFKDLINLPFGKKKNILEIVKKNNLSNKSASPNLKRLIRMSSDPRITKQSI